MKSTGIKGILLLGLLFSFVALSAAEKEKYWLDFDTEKVWVGNRDFSLDSLKIESKSSWLNAVSVFLTENQKNELQNHELIMKISLVQKLRGESSAEIAGGYGEYIECLNQEYFIKNKLDGTGVIAGVIDAGFINVDSGSAFKHLVENDQILGYRDFINPEREDFFAEATSADIHGANVLAYMAGYDQKTKKRIGMATGASFYLARTENGDKEHLVEEDDWVEAIEWMYSKGVKVVNTSLGYSTFDDSTTNHLTTEMDGKTTKITRAAQMASEKGMVIVCSAGNLGHKPWKYISAPADAKGVISVGATTRKEYARAFYSSIGPEYNAFLKPDISCYSDRGTSYASPEIAGFVACILQKYPDLSPEQIKEALFYAGHMNPLPNNHIGYGIPDPELVFEFLEGPVSTIENDLLGNDFIKIKATGRKVKIKHEGELEKNIVVFAKENEVHVLKDYVISKELVEIKFLKRLFPGKKGTDEKYRRHITKKKAEVTLFRETNVKFTTLVIDGELYEVEWK